MLDEMRKAATNQRGIVNTLCGFNGERYGTYLGLETWRTYLEAAGFTELMHYYRPAGLPGCQ